MDRIIKNSIGRYIHPDLEYSYSNLRNIRMALSKLKGDHSRYEWEEMKIFFNGICVRCEKNIYHVEKDHIIPIYQGGSNSIKNIQPICPICNTSKGPENIDHLIRFCKKYKITFPKNWR